MYLSLELLVQKYCIITSLLLFWCAYMVINVSVQCNDGLLFDITLLTLCDSIGLGSGFEAEAKKTTSMPIDVFNILPKRPKNSVHLKVDEAM